MERTHESSRARDAERDADEVASIIERTTEGQERQEEQGVVFESGIEPWSKLAKQEEERLLDKYEEQAQLSDRTKDVIENVLTQETDEARIDFAKKWFADNQGEIREKGYSADQRSEEGYILRVVKEMDGFEALKKNEEYKEFNDKIENRYALRTDLEKNAVPLESQFLMLNTIDKRTERIQVELEAAKNEKDEVTAEAKNKELAELSKVKRELAEKISGRDFKKEGEETNPSLKEKEKYIGEELAGMELRAISGSVFGANEAFYNNASRFFGYKIEEKGRLFWKQAEVKDREGKVLGAFRGISSGEKLNEFLRAEAKKNFSEEWDKKNQDRKVAIEDYINNETKRYAKSPERAEEGIQSKYERVKNRLVGEFIEKGLSREPKGREQLEKMKEEFGERGMTDPHKFIEAVINREGSLRVEEGEKINPVEYLGRIKEFLEEWDLSLPEKDITKIKTEGWDRYQKALKTKKGFLNWLLNGLFGKEEPKAPSSRTSNRRSR